MIANPHWSLGQRNLYPTELSGSLFYHQKDLLHRKTDYYPEKSLLIQEHLDLWDSISKRITNPINKKITHWIDFILILIVFDTLLSKPPFCVGIWLF